MDVLKFSYEYFIRLLVGASGILLGLALASANELISLILWLSGLIYVAINGFHLLTSMFKWFSVSHHLFFLIKGVFKNTTPLNCLSYNALLIGKTVLHFIKFSIFTVFLFLVRWFFKVIFSMATSIGSGQSHSTSSWKPHQKKETGDGFIGGQIVFCENCGRILPMGAIYDRSKPLCHRCWVC